MKLTKMIYVASAYSFNIPKEASAFLKHGKKVMEFNRYKEVTKAIGKLQDLYPYAFIGPITQSHHTVKYMKNRHTSFKHWKLRDLTYISNCDELWVYADSLAAWRLSKGVTEELSFALSNDIPIKIIDPKTYEVKPLKLI